MGWLGGIDFFLPERDFSMTQNLVGFVLGEESERVSLHSFSAFLEQMVWICWSKSWICGEEGSCWRIWSLCSMREEASGGMLGM